MGGGIVFLMLRCEKWNGMGWEREYEGWLCSLVLIYVFVAIGTGGPSQCVSGQLT